MAVLLALASAITYGFADFAGGLASRRARPLAVTAASQAVGLAIAPVLLVLVAAPPDLRAVAVGTAAGVFGGIGLALYFSAMRDGAMGVVSPLSAVAAAGVPVAFALGGGERPSVLALVGVAIALPAVHLAARPAGRGLPARVEVERLPSGAPGPPSARPDAPPDADDPDDRTGGGAVGGVGAAIRVLPGGARRRRAGAAHPSRGLAPGVALGIGSGLAFGMFFVLLDAAPATSGAWPLLGAKLGSLGAVSTLAVARRQPLVPSRGSWRLVAASGVLDMLANLLFLLATREGLLSLVSVIASQYPVVVVVLSVVVLREHLGRPQRAGIVLALVAVLAISLG